MVLASLNPCGAFPLFHYAENNNLRDLKQKIRSAIILHGVAYSSSSKMNLRSHLVVGGGGGQCMLVPFTTRLFSFCVIRDVTSLVSCKLVLKRSSAL